MNPELRLIFAMAQCLFACELVDDTHGHVTFGS